MGTSKTRWWLKIEYPFFQDKSVKALRKKCGADGVITYMKMMLRSLPKDAYVSFEGYGDTLSEEIAMDTDEDDTECIECVIDFLKRHDLMTEAGQGNEERYFFPQADILSGGETASAERMRNKRARDKASQCDNDVQQCEVTTEETEQNTATAIAESKTTAIAEAKQEQEHIPSVSADGSASASAGTASPSRADLFSVGRLQSIADANKVDLNSEGVRRFWEEMHESGWILYQKPVTKEGIVKSLRGWAKYHKEYSNSQEEQQTEETPDWFHDEKNDELEQSIINKALNSETVPGVVKTYMRNDLDGEQRLIAAIWQLSPEEYASDETEYVSNALNMEIGKSNYREAAEGLLRDACRARWECADEEAKKCLARSFARKGKEHGNDITSVTDSFAYKLRAEYDEVESYIRQAWEQDDEPEWMNNIYDPTEEECPW